MTTPTNEPIVLEDRFRDVATEVLTEAKAAAAERDELDRQIAVEAAADKTDETEQERLERELEQVRVRRAGRAKWLSERLSMRRAAATKADRLEQDGRRALAVIEQMSVEQPEDGAAAESAEPEFGPAGATRHDVPPAAGQDGGQPS